jgi:acyl CoA:acetate/3-ketoacid CoA transferase beta subunit
MIGPTRAEVCAVACADTWRAAGEVLLSPFGAIPTVGARLARATFAPAVLLTDGEALLAGGVWPLGESPSVIEGWMPYRSIFDLAWSGKRHVMMIPSQLDRYGNMNISCIGEDYRRPRVQLIGVRGAPGNTVNHPTSYWVPRHSARVFVQRVDRVSGVGYDSAAAAGPSAQRFHDLRRVVTNLGVLDFASSDRTLRLVSVHPGVSVDDVRAATGFPLQVADDLEESRLPTDEELRLIREVIDPGGAREREVGS